MIVFNGIGNLLDVATRPDTVVNILIGVGIGGALKLLNTVVQILVVAAAL
ncbi:MAG: hypothetical protein ACE5F9_12170 [Phycisphaerae bacterium]